MNEFKIVFIFILAVVGWFGYAIEREARIKAERRAKKLYGEKCEEYSELNKFLQNINAVDVKETLGRIVKTIASVIIRTLAIVVIKAGQWLSIQKRFITEQLRISKETIE